MNNILIYYAQRSPTVLHAASALSSAGIAVTDHPTPDATHMLLDIPSLSDGNTLRSGTPLSDVLFSSPEHICVIGGNLSSPLLCDHPVIDLLKDDTYLYKNAAITAQCALSVAADKSAYAFSDCSILIIGWGRIGKHLAFLLRAYGAKISILSTSPVHRAEAASFGFQTFSSNQIENTYYIIFNTAPYPVISSEQAAQLRHAVKIDLASKPGLTASDVIYARGLPGLLAPASSGRLIAQSILRLIKEAKQ